MSTSLLTHVYVPTSQSKRFIDYAPTSLERNYKYELLTEHDLGVHVDLILPEAYEKPEEQVGETSLPFRLCLLTISDIVIKFCLKITSLFYVV